MKIISLILENYNRLLFSNISYLEYRPIEKMQLIIGSNGSGKSSLLRELTPLPAIKGEYTPNGVKIITIEHNGSMYILSSIFNSPKPHSFKKDNVEQNDSGTFTVQKDLVKQFFNITFEIHEMLISSSSFTEYSLLERRKWFTMISDIDYTFALCAFQKLRDRQRDIMGGIKLSKAKLTTLETNILTENDIEMLKSDIKNDYKLIEDLLSLKNNQLDYKDISTEVTNQHNLIDYHLTQLKNTLSKISVLSISETNENKLIEIKTEIEYLQLENGKLEKKFEETQKTLDILNNSNLEETSSTEFKLKDLINEVDYIESKLRYNFKEIDPENLKLAISTNEQILNHIFNNIPANPNLEYSKNTFDILNRNIQLLTNDVLGLKSHRDILFTDIKKLDHLKDHDKNVCPKCEYEWIAGYDANVHAAKVKEYQEVLDTLVVKEKDLESLNVKLEDMKNYLNLYKQYVYIKSNWPILGILFSALEEKDVLKQNPVFGNSILNQLKADTEKAIELKGLNNQIKDLNYLLEINQNNNNLSVSNINDLQEELGNQLNTNIYRIQYLNSLYLTISNSIKNKERIGNLVNNLKDDLLSTNNLYEESILQLQNNIIMDLIKEIKFSLNEKEEKLNRSITIYTTIEETNSVLKEYEDELEVLNNLIDIMSPTNGLIGDSILGFINTFIDQVNNIIKQIWSYPMVIMSCNIDDTQTTELNYKFPVLIKNFPKPSPDISKLSNGMKEVIDLAFKIISMKYLGLENYPLYLDEFGRTFDKHHRQTAINIINNLLLQSDFSQLFLVSHYEDSYGSLVNNDTNVMCKENVVIPENSNSNRLLVK